ncbi:hypothetical protein Cni_G07852 [Canna indica]|uniref:SWIM-type domain-containing protein n=1 Tax=Canna indica TaxID=4628 RepID=A0AAQ3K4R5_9LILI|nr:hypothetical protein Cni_G07852 [Canna indica]
MARWDEILTLPVQNPTISEFSAADIVWSRVEGWREKMDRLALIPFSRVNDFVRGESNNKECPTKFHVEARRRRPPEMAYKPKVDGILEYILYWCSFGPDDHRKGGVVRPSRNYTAKRKTPAGRPNTKRGCVCHFIVKRLIAEPSVALVIYNQDNHVDKKGSPCHGPLDAKSVGTRAMFAPYISDELRLQVMSLLYVGVPVETIMQRHTQMVQKQGGPCSRDDLLTHRFVRRLERKIRRSAYELDPDDDVSIGLWIETHKDHIFFFEDFSDSNPFILGIQTEWQLQQMIQFGNRSIMASDSRFGTHKLKHPIHSLLVFDSNKNAIPVAWIITPDFASREIHRWMGSLYDRVRSKDPTWQLGGFIVDDPLADMLSIREVFHCSVLISFWRVSHALRKKLIEKCLQRETQAMMSRRLGEAVSSICTGHGDMELFEAFMEDFVDCSDFLDYFRATWLPRIGAWIAALKSIPVASSEVSTAIESYHNQLKLRLLNEKDSSVYQRADWLVDKLGTKVHSYYWLDEYSEKDSFARYWKDEWRSGNTSWRQSLQIPDSDVSITDTCARVVNQKNRQKVHMILNPGSEFAICDCDWSRMGNLCEHVIKATKFYRERGLAAPSSSLFQFNQTLRRIFHCPPHDSVIRDHAIALSVSVRTLLNSLIDIENGSLISNIKVHEEQQTANDRIVPVSKKSKHSDRDTIAECQPVSDNTMEISANESTGLVTLDERGENFDTKSVASLESTEKLVTLVPIICNPIEDEAGCLFDRTNGFVDDRKCEATTKIALSDEDLSADPMVIDTVTNSAGSLEKPLVNEDVENRTASISVDHNDATEERQVRYVADDSCNISAILETSAVYDTISDVDQLTKETISCGESCDTDFKEVPAKPCNDQMMDLDIANKNVGVGILKGRDAVVDQAPEESARNVQMIRLEIEVLNQNAEDHSVIDNKISANHIEVQVVDSCSPCGKNNAKVANNVISIGNGTSNSIEESGNDLMVT